MEESPLSGTLTQRITDISLKLEKYRTSFLNGDGSSSDDLIAFLSSCGIEEKVYTQVDLVDEFVFHRPLLQALLRSERKIEDEFLTSEERDGEQYKAKIVENFKLILNEAEQEIRKKLVNDPLFILLRGNSYESSSHPTSELNAQEVARRMVEISSS